MSGAARTKAYRERLKVGSIIVPVLVCETKMSMALIITGVPDFGLPNTMTVRGNVLSPNFFAASV